VFKYVGWLSKSFWQFRDLLVLGGYIDLYIYISPRSLNILNLSKIKVYEFCQIFKPGKGI